MLKKHRSSNYLINKLINFLINYLNNCIFNIKDKTISSKDPDIPATRCCYKLLTSCLRQQVPAAVIRGGRQKTIIDIEEKIVIVANKF